jgi:hypothetical protein
VGKSSPPGMVQPIESANSVLEKLNTEIRDLRDEVNWPLTPLNIALGVVGAIVGALLYVTYLSVAHS